MLFLALLDSNATFIGSLEVHGLMEETPELGIWIAKEEQGKGYAYEALACVLERLFGRWTSLSSCAHGHAAACALW